MGSQSSKPVRSAANAARRYPKQPISPPTATPSASKAAAQPQARNPSPPPEAPSREPQTGQNQGQGQEQGPTYHSKQQPSFDKSDAIDLDGRDPHFAASLRTIGPVNPFPTYSPSSTFTQPPSQTSSEPTPLTQQTHPQSIFPSAASNPALLVVSARQRIAKAAEREAEQLGKAGFAGRELPDAFTIRQAVVMRDRQKLSERTVEENLKLKRGIMERLGKGIVGLAE